MEQKKVVKKVVKKPSKIKKDNKFIDTIKRNWKNVLLIILLLFSLSKCTSSCTRGRTIDRLNYQIVQMDSIITSNGIELDKLSTRLDDAQSSINNYKGIATGNQQELINKVNTLTDENKTLVNENKKLKKKITDLEKTINDLKNDET